VNEFVELARSISEEYNIPIPDAIEIVNSYLEQMLEKEGRTGYGPPWLKKARD